VVGHRSVKEQKTMDRRPFIVPVFVPHGGCPHHCVFCNQKSITGHGDATLSPGQVRNRISRFLEHKGSRRGLVEVAFYGGSFLALPATYQRALMDEAQDFIEKGRVNSLRFSTRPDTIAITSLDTLNPYSVGAIELGAQSMDNAVLSLCQRGHRAEDTCRAVALLKSRGFAVGIQIMPGLPGDTTQSIIETGRRVASLEPDFVRIYPTIVVKHTVLEKWFLSGRYEPLTLDQAVETSKTLWLLFEKHNIPVIRMGLQPNDSLLAPGNVVAGPFHPAFGHLVYSEVFFHLAVRELERQRGLSKKVTLAVFPNAVPKTVGQNKRNVERLAERFNLDAIRVMADATVPDNTVRVVGAPKPEPDYFSTLQQ
jgi:histone acetyltransferase (RNA polymerase elongator complex component)